MREDVRTEIGTIAPIDGLRGIAVLWVVAFHYVVVRSFAGIDDPWIEALARVPRLDALALNGYLGVDLFFLISGFLLAAPWFVHAREGLAPPSVGRFYARRVRRILPAYYLQLVFLFALVLPLLHGRKYWRSDVYVDLWNAAAHALFLQNTSPLTSGSLGANGALWTLAVEAQFYLLLPLVMPWFVRAPRRSLAASIALALAWQWAAAHDLEPWVAIQLAWGAHWSWSEATVRDVLAIQLPAFAGHLALGIALAGAWVARRDAPAPRKTTLLAVLGLVLLALTITGHVQMIPGREHRRMVPTLALAMLLWAGVSAKPGFLARILGAGPLAATGRWSYSMYLYHLPLLLLWNVYARGIGGWLALPAYLAAAFGIAWISWRYVERPFLEGRFKAMFFAGQTAARPLPQRELSP
jgi:peptidoglycan/LPS O-acetylase OafA/YrhL